MWLLLVLHHVLWRLLLVVSHAVRLLILHGVIFVILLDHVRIFGNDFFTSHSEALEQKIGLSTRYHIVLFFSDEVSGLDFEVLFVLAFYLGNIVAERLLLNASTNHLLFVFCQLLVGNRRLSRWRILGSLLLLIAFTTCRRVASTISLGS